MAKKCHLCDVTKTFQHLGRNVCEKCFVRLIERRVKRNLDRVFSKGDKVLVIGDLAEYFLKKSVKNLPLEITKRKKIINIKKYDKVVVESTMDDVDAGFLAEFFGKDFKIDKNEKIIKILSAITDEEALRFARIKGIDFEVKEENKKIKEFLKKIGQEHPEVRFNLLRNVREVEEIL